MHIASIYSFVASFSYQNVLLLHLSLQAVYLGVVAKAIDSKNIDGKICLQRVSEEKGYAKTTYSQHFSDHALVNGFLKGGEWKDNLRVFWSLK